MNYNHKEVEKKWQEIWEEKEVFKASNDSIKPKYYALMEFPYPSGAGLHVGHPRGMTALDVIARKRRLEGYNVLYPMGWDAFGLPTENYAIKNKIHPRIATDQNIKVFKRQLKSLGFSFDWSREIDTTDPMYYKWTQWIFLKLFEHGLAYKSKATINWCTSCKIGLANEETEGGKCERCGGEVVQKEKEQWMLRMTEYAEKLIDGLKETNYIERVKTSQINWIGKSSGAEVDFKIKDMDKNIRVYTTRPDTLFGATYMVIAPEHPLIEEIKERLSNIAEINKYKEEAKKKTDFERTELVKNKTGVELRGIKAINPVNNEEIPIWISDYVMMGYGSGAIMAVPAHDERDYEFAKKFGIPIKQVIAEQFINDGKDKVREGKPFVKRKTINVIVKHWAEEKVLYLDWAGLGWKSFVVGGIEDGEMLDDAAIREVKEETGYQNMKIVKVFESEYHSIFYAGHKGINRHAIVNTVVVELQNDEYIEPKKQEKELHLAYWVDIEAAGKVINLKNHLKNLDTFINGETAYTGDGVLINSEFLDDLKVEEAKNKMTEWLIGKGIGQRKTNYRLKDWVFSRQKYWGEPIPMVHCDKCKYVPVPYEQLPVELPYVKSYEYTDTGESPLAKMTDWVKTTCPKCGGEAKRETDVMPNWAGSSWYYLRYMDPHNDKELASKEIIKYWDKIDWYNGGMEHTTRHLLYARFWHKFLYDIGVVPTSEPFNIRTSHGMILAADGNKMSKSKGNVVNPDEIVEAQGADTLRTYEMFIGDFEKTVAWSENGVTGSRRFLDRVWKIQDKVISGDKYSKDTESIIHKTIKKVTDDYENMKFNTGIAALMTLLNKFNEKEKIKDDDYKVFLTLLNPVAPHITEELWTIKGYKGMLNEQAWPKYDKEKLIDDTIEVPIQVNGKLKAKIVIDRDEEEASVLEKMRCELVGILEGREIVKEIYVKGKIVNVVVK
ncbi:MAG: leucine--tRNA ligase [Clostridiales bacterium GWD2_32_59]|nr:MAG: leucine--tRNA ligase [Clostridiales bacterium GWD2_32_59]